MCEAKKYPRNPNPRIDSCMRPWIRLLESLGVENIVACCCGHSKYPATIVLRKLTGFYEAFSNTKINRKRKFYKRDSEGVYFIPEVC